MPPTNVLHLFLDLFRNKGETDHASHKCFAPISSRSINIFSSKYFKSEGGNNSKLCVDATRAATNKS